MRTAPITSLQTSSPPRVVPRRLLPSLSILTLAVFANYAGILQILLPNQIEALDPANKVNNLALVTSVSFVFTIFAQPLTGALSDRTRGRFGRRVPWMIGGSVVAGGFLVGMGGLGSVLWICVFWVVVQFALNATDVTSSAVVADRVPRERRGVASAVLGAGAMGGGAVGTLVAGRLADDHLSLAYVILGIGVVVVTVLYAVFNRESPVVESDGGGFHWRAFARSFWLSPRQHPDFAWAFGSRFLFIVGYCLILTYQLYILTDYVGVSNDEANQLVGLFTVAGFATTVVGVIVGGWWSDRIGRRKIFLVVASGFLIVALAGPLVSASTTAMLWFALVQGLGSGLYLSCGTALVIDVLPHHGQSAAKDLGIYNVATNVPQAAAPIVAAFVINAFDGYRALFLVGVLGAAASAVLITRVKSVR